MIYLTLKAAPKSEHSLYQTTCRGRIPRLYMTNEAKKLKESYQWQVREQYKGEILKGEIELLIDLYFDSKRTHDWDNFHRLVCDSLIGLVIEDDSQFNPVTVSKNYDKKDPRVELRLNPLNA